MMNGRREKRSLELRRFDWDAIAGIIAAGAALVLHFLHIIETDVLLTIALVVMALLLFRDLRREAQDEQLIERSERVESALEGIRMGLVPADVTLLGPRQLRNASVAFARNARGEMTWFNVCLLMFRPQPLFDALLLPALENPRVSSIQFVLDESERERWTNEVVPKAQATGHGAKLREPRWAPLSHHAVSFILADNEEGKTEAQLSFWGEPFMSRNTDFDIPRYVLHVHPHSELVGRLVEIERQTRSRA
jgi:hypothetical protein